MSLSRATLNSVPAAVSGLRAKITMSDYWYLPLALSLVPLAFLIYSLINLRKLKIRLTHPRVLVELGIFLILLLVSLSLLLS
jgi:hypothetical protein